MSRKSEDVALLAAFLAKKSATQIPTGARTMTEKEVYLANRGIKPTDNANSNAVVWRVVTDHCGREFYINRNGEYL